MHNLKKRRLNGLRRPHKKYWLANDAQINDAQCERRRQPTLADSLFDQSAEMVQVGEEIRVGPPQFIYRPH